MKKLIAVFFIIALATIAINTIFASTVLPVFQHYIFYFSVLLVFSSSLAFQILVSRAKGRKQSYFSNLFMAGSTIKLFIYVVYAALCFYFLRPLAIEIAVHLMIVYLVFAITETMVLLRLQKKSD